MPHGQSFMLMLRRRAMTCSHVDAARGLIESMPGLTALIPQIGTTRSGRPCRPDNVRDWFENRDTSEQAAIIGKMAVINVNLGYAYESGFKLLLNIEGITYPTGGDGHNLPKLYMKLPAPVKRSICRLHRNVDLTDLEFEEAFSITAQSHESPEELKRDKFVDDLQHYHKQGYFQQSRYKYADADGQKPIRMLLPLRFEALMHQIVEHVIDPRFDL